jgi:tRNA (guanine-N7-)-methyltransferase
MNVRAIAADARCVLAHLIPDASVAAYHLYFPDPWPKTRHRRRRLVTGAAASDIVRTLVRDGAVHVASDLAPLVEDVAACLARAGLARVPDAVPPVERPTTLFERKYARLGTHYARLLRQG